MISITYLNNSGEKCVAYRINKSWNVYGDVIWNGKHLNIWTVDDINGKTGSWLSAYARNSLLILSNQGIKIDPNILPRELINSDGLSLDQEEKLKKLGEHLWKIFIIAINLSDKILTVE